jgi:hypothetical protein
MSAAEIDAEVTNVLRAIAGEDCIGILLGAGASLGAGLPGWDSLAVELLISSGVISDHDTAVNFLRGQDAALAAEAARAATDNWPVLLRAALYGKELEEPKPTPLHLAVAWLATTRGAATTRLFTLNFDSLLESALEELDPDLKTFSRGTAAPRAPTGFSEITHLHGALPVTGASTDGVILTLSDYTEMNRTPHPWQVGALQDITQRGPLILAGTSYRDPDIRQWLSDLQITSSAGTGRGLVIFLAREGLGLSRAEFKIIRTALTEQWEAIGVQVLVTHDHADAAQAFLEMNHTNDAGYRPPRERALGLWNLHVADFAKFQQEHSAQLAVDVQRLHAQLGDQANLTLWLSDGAGQIVRWASNDRIYNSEATLRRVTPGFDSEWVVGQCMGRDETLAQNLSRSTTLRWRSVVAKPVKVVLEGGPAFSVAALSTATPLDLDRISPDAQDAWTATVDELSEEWGIRLASVT